MARHGGTALDAAEARGHGSCAEVLRKVGGRHSMQRTLAAKFRWRLMELCGVFFFGRGEIDCRSDGLCFFLCLRVFVLNVFFWLAMRRVRVKDGFDDWFYFGPADEDKKEMSWTYTVYIDYNSWFGKSGFFNKKSWQISQINFQLVVTKKKPWVFMSPRSCRIGSSGDVATMVAGRCWCRGR